MRLHTLAWLFLLCYGAAALGLVLLVLFGITRSYLHAL